MKVKVTTAFNDAHTKELHKIGDVLDVSVERVNEILRAGNYIQLVAEPTEPEAPDQESGGEPEKVTRRKRTGK